MGWAILYHCPPPSILALFVHLGFSKEAGGGGGGGGGLNSKRYTREDLQKPDPPQSWNAEGKHAKYFSNKLRPSGKRRSCLRCYFFSRPPPDWQSVGVLVTLHSHKEEDISFESNQLRASGSFFLIITHTSGTNCFSPIIATEVQLLLLAQSAATFLFSLCSARRLIWEREETGS